MEALLQQNTCLIGKNINRVNRGIKEMKRVSGSNPKVSVDSTGGLITVDWTCPHCGEYNMGLHFSSNVDVLNSGNFEIDLACDNCGKMVTVECENSGQLFN